jgi:hypothetical protein
MATKKRAKRRSFSEGVYVEFHGAFKDETRAKTKARKVGGWYVRRTTPRIGRRFVVMAERAPF